MSGTPLVTFDRVSKSFPSADGAGPGIYAVRELSFTVEKGERVVVVGQTGCGKSTMFNLLAGLLEPSQGKVTVAGHDPFREFNWFRGKIGIVFQNDRLLPWRTALENAAYGLELNHMPVAERTRIAAGWLERLGLGGHENEYPPALSGGMRQRVSIARAFAIKPEILLCDEPFSALDEVTANGLRHELRELVEETGATCLFITHSIDEALQLGQRIVVFQRPARIAYAAAIGGDPAEHEAIRGNILRVLAQERAA